MVCHLTTSYPTARVPYAGHFIRALAAAQKQAGISVSVIAPEAERIDVDRSGVKQVDAHPENGNVPVTGFTAPAALDAAGGLKALLEQDRFMALASAPALGLNMLASVLGTARRAEVIHAHWLTPSGAVALAARGLVGVPAVVTARGSDVALLESSPAGRLFARMFKKIPVAAVSAPLAARLRALGFERVRTIEQPLSVAHLPAWPSSGREPNRLLWVGSLVADKNAGLAIRAVAAFPDVMLEVVGDGPERQTLEKLARDSRVEDRVIFHGSVSPDSVAGFHRAAGALLFTSLKEGRPNAVLEAAWLGTPVIASAIPAVTEFGGLRRAVRLYEPGSLDGLIAAIRSHLARPAGSREFAERAKESLDLPSWPETVRSYSEMYRSARALTA